MSGITDRLIEYLIQREQAQLFHNGATQGAIDKVGYTYAVLKLNAMTNVELLEIIDAMNAEEGS